MQAQNNTSLTLCLMFLHVFGVGLGVFWVLFCFCFCFVIYRAFWGGGVGENTLKEKQNKKHFISKLQKFEVQREDPIFFNEILYRLALTI